MSFLDLARTRRSVRAYAATPIPHERLERCLEAARLAPSACNSQPWSFIVVDEPGLRDALGAAAFSGIYRMNRFAADAPVLVAVVTERSRYAAALAGTLRGTPYNLIDIGIAVEHFVLQAAEEGLGTCWLGWFDARGVRRVLGLSRHARVDVLVSMGYPAQEPGPAKPRRALSEIRRYNQARLADYGVRDKP